MVERRAHPRHPSAWPAILRCRNETFAATIVDVSAGGLRVRLERAVYLGACCSVSASLFAEDLRCRVVWTEGMEVGLEIKTTPDRRKRAGAA